MTSSKGRRPADPSVADRAGAGNYRGGGAREGMRLAIAASRFNGAVTERLVSGAIEELAGRGADLASVTVAWAPGAFELPLVASRLAKSGEHDAIVCLGAVIRGQTGHYDFVAGQCAAGLQRAQQDTGVPVIFGVLTTDTIEQAMDRAGGEAGHKGVEAALAAIETVDLMRQLEKGGA